MAKIKAPAARMLGDNFLVKQADAPQQTAEGVVLSEEARKSMRANVGVVVAAGPNSPVKVGEWVAWQFAPLNPLKLPEGEYLKMTDRDIACVLTDAPAEVV
jgi:co-chaperonin GroES (HSP10)